MRDLILNNIQEGVILTDHRTIITYMNRRCEHILGLRPACPYSHPAGRLAQGDWIVIIDTALGVDDGGLVEQDLLGIGFEGHIKKNDGLLIWAQVGKGYCKHLVLDQHHKHQPIAITCEKFPLINRAQLDSTKQQIDLEVGQIKLHKSYKMAYGYMAIFSEDGKLKFYQEDGYSIRRESIKEILMGGQFQEKAEGIELSMVGKTIDACFVDYFQLNQAESYLINGIPVVIKRQDLVWNAMNFTLYLLEDITALSKQRILTEEAMVSVEALKATLSQQTPVFNRFNGISDIIQETMKHAQKAALVDSHMLIYGESGTGKSLIAREIHTASPRRNMPFIAVNCASIPDALFESEMYGYVKGAFTGANDTGKQGYFEVANGGTLFLDEISELSLLNQAKLLHAIQEQRIARLGSVASVQLDIRIICATNKDLMEEIHNRRFREDLYYRLNVINLVIPPLRYRREDIQHIAERRFKEIGHRFQKCSPEKIQLFIRELMELPLHGNVRELENKVEQFLAMGGHVSNDPYRDDGILLNQHPKVSYEAEMEAFEKRLILQSLEVYGHQIRKTYEALGMKKSTFYDKIKKLSIEIPKK